MCPNVILDGHEYETVAELRAVCPRLVCYGPIRDDMLYEDSCLCQVNLYGTARANGYTARDTDDWMDVEFVREEPPDA